MELLSGEEAILEASLAPFDLLVSDVMLPGISGLELMETLKSKQPDLKVILVSGVADKNIRVQVAEAGADAHFFKPVEMADFLDGVERALGMVETMLPSELSVEKTDAAISKSETVSLSGRIADLRQEMDASCVYLMNELGQVLVRAGEMPDHEIETKLAADIMAVILTNNRVSEFLGNSSSENVTFFQGKTFNLTLSPVGQTYALLLATEKTHTIAFERIAIEMSAAVKDIYSTLSILGLSPKTGTTGQLSEGTTGTLIDPELEKIFEKAQSKDIRKEEIETFWDSMDESEIPEVILNEDALSYEQAQEMGLTPS